MIRVHLITRVRYYCVGTCHGLRRLKAYNTMTMVVSSLLLWIGTIGREGDGEAGKMENKKI